MTSQGCNLKNDWSCDFKIEKALYRAGFKTERAGFFGSKISSITKGCANDFIPEFHVVSENLRRPRLQCGHCTRLEEIESSGHWDGPLGGGNDLLRRGAINGWYFNHKAEFLFYESYLNPKNCKKLENFVPSCDDSKVLVNGKDYDVSKEGNLIVSLIDGFGFDFERQIYCRIKDSDVLKHQSADTDMKHYRHFIELANKVSPTSMNDDLHL